MANIDTQTETGDGEACARLERIRDFVNLHDLGERKAYIDCGAVVITSTLVHAAGTLESQTHRVASFTAARDVLGY